MKSATAVTYELDDISIAVTELSGQIREKLALDAGAHSVGILYAQPDTEVAELSARLAEELGFSIIGGTTAGGAILSNEGHHELAVVLHVLTSPDCRFATAITPPLSTLDAREHIAKAYEEALARLRERENSAEPKLIFFAIPILPTCSPDSCLAALDETSEGVPVLGFMAADDFEFSKQQIFRDGESSGDRIALLLISGDIEPIFEVRNLAASQTLSKRRVTKSRGNIICEIDGKPAYEYIKGFPFIEEESDILWNYQFFVEIQNETGSGGALISRSVNTYNKETGEISCFGDIPQDSYISLEYCNGENVTDSCEKALGTLKEKIAEGEKGDYRYSTILAISCASRYLFLAGQKDAEGVLIRKMIPPHLAISGLYTYGEIAPTSFIKNGRDVNRFHNATLTICAL